MLQQLNSLKIGNTLVCEIALSQNKYIGWLVIRPYKNNQYIIREELFKLEDIKEGLDPIGNHIFRNEVIIDNLSNIHEVLAQKGLSLIDFKESWNTEYPL